MENMVKGWKNCAVLSCGKTSGSYPDLAFHHFPRNLELRETWLQNVNNPNLRSLDNELLRNKFSVCCKHFPTSQYQTKERKKLNRNAVPSLIDNTEELISSDFGCEEDKLDQDKDLLNEEKMLSIPLEGPLDKESLSEKKSKLKEEFNEILDRITTQQELNLVKREIAPILPTLMALKCLNKNKDNKE